MNKLFRITFIHGEILDLYAAEYARLVELLSSPPSGQFVTFAPIAPDGTPAREIMINVNHIAFIKEFSLSQAAGVVTPNTPQMIRKQVQIEEAAKSADLGAVLDSVKQEAKNPNAPA